MHYKGLDVRCPQKRPLNSITHSLTIKGGTVYNVSDILSGNSVGMHPANERSRYNVTASPIGWMQTKTVPCIVMTS